MKPLEKAPQKGRSLLEKGFSEIASEWYDEKPIANFTQGSNYKAVWKCRDCGNQWKAKVSKRYREGTGCPHCPRGRAKSREGSIISLFPEIAVEWNDTRDATTVSPYSGYSAQWKCRNCSSEWKATVSNRTRLGNGCPYCAGKIVLSGKTDLLTTHPEVLSIWSPDNTVPISEVSAGSRYRALWLCTVCGNEWKAAVNSIIRGRGCPYCSGSKVLRGFNDLGTSHPELCKEWDDKKSFYNLTAGSHYVATWKCSLCRQRWKAPVNNRSRRASSGCPHCSGRIARPGINDLGTLYPDLALSWDDERSVSTVSPGSSYLARWKCAEGHVWNAKVYSRVRGNGCFVCFKSNAASRAEKEMVEYLETVTTKHIEQGNRSVIKPYELDAYLPELRIAFEFNGNYWHSDEHLLKSRNITSFEYHSKKRKLCADRGIVLYFIWESDWVDRKNEVKEAVSAVINGERMSPKILLKLESTSEIC